MSEMSKHTIDETVDLFVHGAKTMLAGRFLDVQALYMKGLAIIDKAVETLDTMHAKGREPLLPLLEHKDEMVRTVAGCALWQSATDRARQTIEKVDRYGITEASMLACKILLFHGRYNVVSSDPRYEGLYDGEHDEKKCLDPDFNVRALRGELPTTFALKATRLDRP